MPMFILSIVINLIIKVLLITFNIMQNMESTTSMNTTTQPVRFTASYR
jgi:hypothetical protein